MAEVFPKGNLMRERTTRFRLMLVLILALAIASGGSDIQAASSHLDPRQTRAASVDGIKHPAEGYIQAALQDTPTHFGDNSDATATAANGSELDGAYYRLDDTHLALLLTGNLETNFTNLNILIDSRAGGQNSLRADTFQEDLSALAGLRLDSNFAADYYLNIVTGNSPVETYGFFIETPTEGGSVGGELGSGIASVITMTNGIVIAIDNSNTVGVGSTTINTPATVATGIEILIPLAEIGNPSETIKISAFINSPNQAILSNQVLGGIGGGDNLGAPADVDFSSIDGRQFFNASPALLESPLCGDLFFSEYIEGSGNNQALELYNGTGKGLTLDGMGYTVELYANGAAAASQVYPLTGTLPFGDVLVIANSAAAAEILAVTDVTANVALFDGNDALVLRKAGTVIDAIGRVGEDPGSEWGSGTESTADNTLVRKPTVGGDQDPSDAFTPATGWVGYPVDTFTHLGHHRADCAGLRLLISEVVVNPTAGEFVEIYNPNSSPMDLSNVYMTDATFPSSSTYYYNIVTGSNAGGGSFADFNARFPAGASIAPGEYQTVALAGSAAYSSTYGSLPTYELFEDGVSPDALPDMREATAGSINKQGGLTNAGEGVILYTWDGVTDLVTDLDYFLWGNRSVAVDKTNVSIDGPDADEDLSIYLADTPIATQSLVSAATHATGASWQRKDLNEGKEIKVGGNGAGGDNETSEDLNNTFCENSATPGAANQCPLPNAFGVCQAAATAIHAVQGSGTSSPLVGSSVVLEGIVVGDFQSTSTQLGGFFLQEEDNQTDANSATSEGIFVYDNGFGTDVATGALVRVQGVVAENAGQTQLGGIMNMAVCANGRSVTPTVIDLPVADVATLEAYEGMLISVPETLYVTDHYNLGRFGEIGLSAESRLMQPTQVVSPGTPASNMQTANNRARLLLDDGSTVQNPATVPYWGPNNTLRAGDTVAGLTGVLGYGFGNYRVQPTLNPIFTQSNVRTAAPQLSGQGRLTSRQFQRA